MWIHRLPNQFCPETGLQHLLLLSLSSERKCPLFARNSLTGCSTSVVVSLSLIHILSPSYYCSSFASLPSPPLFYQGVQVVAGIIFLPGVILFLTAICSGICQSSKVSTSGRWSATSPPTTFFPSTDWLSVTLQGHNLLESSFYTEGPGAHVLLPWYSKPSRILVR